MGTRDYGVNSITPEQAKARADQARRQGLEAAYAEAKAAQNRKPLSEQMREIAREEIARDKAESQPARRAHPPFEG